MNKRKCIMGCDEGVTNYCLPDADNFPERRKEWLRALGIKVEPTIKQPVVCMHHFSEKQRSRVRLYSFAVPDINLGIVVRNAEQEVEYKYIAQNVMPKKTSQSTQTDNYVSEFSPRKCKLISEMQVLKSSVDKLKHENKSLRILLESYAKANSKTKEDIEKNLKEMKDAENISTPKRTKEPIVLESSSIRRGLVALNKAPKMQLQNDKLEVINLDIPESESACTSDHITPPQLENSTTDNDVTQPHVSNSIRMDPVVLTKRPKIQLDTKTQSDQDATKSPHAIGNISIRSTPILLAKSSNIELDAVNDIDEDAVELQLPSSIRMTPVVLAKRSSIQLEKLNHSTQEVIKSQPATSIKLTPVVLLKRPKMQLDEVKSTIDNVNDSQSSSFIRLDSVPLNKPPKVLIGEDAPQLNNAVRMGPVVYSQRKIIPVKLTKILPK